MKVLTGAAGLEGRIKLGTKGNAGQQSTHRSQSRARVAQARTAEQADLGHIRSHVGPTGSGGSRVHLVALPTRTAVTRGEPLARASLLGSQQDIEIAL